MANQVLPLLVGLLVTHCYRLPLVVAIPDKKDLLMEEDWPLRRSYRLEDFLWTGSGDGGQEGRERDNSLWVTTTMVRTTTVVMTVLLATPDDPLASPTCCSLAATSLIRPTPTVSAALATPTVPQPSWWPESPTPTLHPRYWLLTVLLMNASQPVPEVSEMENRLARLFKEAFNRQQEHHLGLNVTAMKAALQTLHKSRGRRVSESVSVHLHNQSIHDAGKLSLLYTVRVAGKPVLAYAAAADMRLISADEMTAELGHPVLTKAEPYLKDMSRADGSWRHARARDTWLLLGSASAALFMLLMLAVVLALSLSKRKRGKRRVLASTGLHRGTSNTAYMDDEHTAQVSDMPGKNSPRFHGVAPLAGNCYRDGDVEAGEDGVVVSTAARRKSSTSSSDSSDTSLVRRRPTHLSRGPDNSSHSAEPPQPQPRTRLTIATRAQREVAHKQCQPAVPTKLPESRHRTSEEPLVPTVGVIAVSPNSFLSMPSIKSFPRGANIPEPLVRVLEPVSVKHLDAEEGVVAESVRRLARHGSLEGGDPGVIGPVVWDMHCHRTQFHQPPGEPIIEDLVLDVDGPAEEECGAAGAVPSVGRMRHRFQELLDDALSLFGSRSNSPTEEEESGADVALQRVRSAIVRGPVGEPLPGSEDCAPRPQTSSNRRPATASAFRPRGAWGTTQTSPCGNHPGSLPRPLSAGPFHRPLLPGPLVVDRTLVLSEEHLPPRDPAVPLIAAIKEELRRFQNTATLPGST